MNLDHLQLGRGIKVTWTWTVPPRRETTWNMLIALVKQIDMEDPVWIWIMYIMSIVARCLLWFPGKFILANWKITVCLRVTCAIFATGDPTEPRQSILRLWLHPLTQWDIGVSCQAHFRGCLTGTEGGGEILEGFLSSGWWFGTWILWLPIWVCLKMLCTPKPNGFHDHYPVFKWLFHWEYTLFSDKPINIGNFIIPSDELIFFRGVGIPPTSLCWFVMCLWVYDVSMLMFYDVVWCLSGDLNQRELEDTESLNWQIGFTGLCWLLFMCHVFLLTRVYGLCWQGFDFLSLLFDLGNVHEELLVWRT